MSKSVKRGRIWMMAQQLDPSNFDWTIKGFNDATIISKASEFEDANSPYYDPKSQFHYIYKCYKNYYFKFGNEYQKSFDDYKAIFTGKSQDVANKVGLHLMMRICFYYFVNSYKNNKKYTHKGKKPRIPEPPVIAWVLHDADISQNGGIVKPHLHFALRFPKQVTVNQLYKWSGVKPQYFESGNGGRYAFENELAYLIHAKQPQKHQYSPKRVHANFDYLKYYRNHKDNWALRSADLKIKINQRGIGWLEDQVKNNPQMTYKRILLDDRLYNIMTSKPKYINEISNLFRVKADRIAVQTEDLIERRKLNLSVIYIWGASGSGKTMEADRIIKKLQKEHPDWAVYKTAQSSKEGSSHPFDDYSGEPIIFFDEARNDDLSAEAWLALLDALHTNTLSARYHNVHIASRVIIMTTTEDPVSFFGFMQGVHSDEPLSQFMRRIGLILKVLRVNNHNSVMTYQSIHELPGSNSINLMYGSGDARTKKATHYVSYPASPKAKSPSEATNRAIEYINKNNDPKVKHVPGNRPVLNSSAADNYKNEMIRSGRATGSLSYSSNSLGSKSNSFNSDDDLPF